MFLAMILAHLVGDYILQTNQIALWKSKSLWGVTIHCAIVALVTWLFALPFQPDWFVVPLICAAHYAIDAAQFLIKPKLTPLTRFSLDQLGHFIVIVVALYLGGFIDIRVMTQTAVHLVENRQKMLFMLGYAFVTMPSWVVIKFAAYGLIIQAPPNFVDNDKYIGIIERLLVVTFVVLGQFYLAPLVIAPRLMLGLQERRGEEETAVFLAESLISLATAVAVGLTLSYLS